MDKFSQLTSIFPHHSRFVLIWEEKLSSTPTCLFAGREVLTLRVFLIHLSINKTLHKCEHNNCAEDRNEINISDMLYRSKKLYSGIKT